MGPSLSSDQQSVIAPVRGTRPYVGLNPVIPQRMLGATMLPPVSLPIEKPTKPAAVAAPGPALEPEAPSSGSHGLATKPNVVEGQRTQTQFRHQHGACLV